MEIQHLLFLLLDTDVNNTELFSVDAGMQQWRPSALLSSHTALPTAANNIHNEFVPQNSPRFGPILSTRGEPPDFR